MRVRPWKNGAAVQTREVSPFDELRDEVYTESGHAQDRPTVSGPVVGDALN